LIVEQAAPGRAPKLVFSGLDSSVAGEIEGAFAAGGHFIVSNSKNYRMDAAVPLLIPEINGDHLKLLDTQAAARGWKGRIVTNPNCSVIALAMAIAPLRQFGLKSVMVTTLQAISGAGYPGVASWEILGNVIPFIDGEEEKFQPETQKILGQFKGGAVELHPVVVSATTTRVPVHNGHTVSISAKFDQKVAAEALDQRVPRFRGHIRRSWNYLRPRSRSFTFRNAIDRSPLDVNRDGGMTVSVGRLRACPVLDYKFVALGHNTIRGAAGAAILNAELMHREGIL
jgi:aspartate-semialdehyde dehydrogenase